MNAARAAQWIESTNAQIASVLTFGGELDDEMMLVMDALVLEMFEAHAVAFGLRFV